MSVTMQEMHTDIGLVNTIVARSSLSFIDGEKGVLEYVGYDIDDLARQSTFEETAFLLWNRRLPSNAELADFFRGITDPMLFIIYIYENIKLLLRPLVFVPMAIDLLHHGHIKILKKSSELGTVIVGLMTDKGLINYKGPPLIKYKYRKDYILKIQFLYMDL